MKEKLKRRINLIILIALAIVAFVFVKNIPSIVATIKDAQIEKISKIEEQEAQTIVEPGDDTLPITWSTYSFENGYVKINFNGTEWYCIQKGAELKHDFALGEKELTYEDIKTLANAINNLPSSSWQSTKYHWHYDNDMKSWYFADTFSKPEFKSIKYYFKTGSQTYKNSMESFGLTYGTVSGWSELKQQFVWGSPMSDNEQAPAIGSDAQKVIKWAKNYAKYAADKSQAGSFIKGDGNASDNSAIQVQYNYNEQSYLVGPFKLDYAKSNYGDISFGGVTNMYIVDENGSKIEIEEFVINGKSGKPKYFTPKDGQYTDETANLFYPDANQEFFVKYKATSTTPEQIDKLHVEFKWLDSTEVKVNEYKTSRKYYVDIDHEDHDKSEEEILETVYSYKCDISASVKSENLNAQDLMQAMNGKREPGEGSIDIPIPNHPTPTPTPTPTPSPTPTPTPSKDKQISLGGHVWEDLRDTKEQKVDGVKNGNDIPKKGVEVILYEQNGKEVARTVTGEDGSYLFNDLSATKKYYMQYIYDGQVYQPTEYNKDITIENKLKAGGYSTATEKQSDREAFNNNFAEIFSAPENYTVRNPKFITSAKNTVYIIGKYSDSKYCKENHDHEKENCSTPYGIKEIYDYVIDQAVEKKNYEDAYKAALDKFGNNDETKSKLQFIEDCRISSWSGDNGNYIYYPIYDAFVESTVDRYIDGVLYHALYPSHYNIDFGLTKRETFDLAIRKDVEKAVVEINGKSHTYKYDQRGDDENSAWDIKVRLSDAYYSQSYERKLYAEDYQYKASMYNDAEHDAEFYGKQDVDELEVYVTYKITIRNQSDIVGEITELVDYFDEDYEYVNERSYITTARRGEHQDVKKLDSSKKGNTKTIDGYNALYVNGLEGIKLDSGAQVYVYLTFKVKKDVQSDGNQWIKLDEKISTAEAIGVGKENIVEIDGYKTYYYDGAHVPNIGDLGKDNVAGVLDHDSVPGNIDNKIITKDGNTEDMAKKFEDDTDKAPNIRLILYRDENGLVFRQIDGTAWEDLRDELNKDQATAVGNGIKDDKENAINGITVQLVELTANGKEKIWKTFSSGQNRDGSNPYDPVIAQIGYPSDQVTIPSSNDRDEGKYVFRSYIPGNYVVRFYYGDTLKTVLPAGSAFGNQGQNAKSYNGQDYKTTTYQEGINQDRQYVWRTKSTWTLGRENLGDIITVVQTFKPDYSNNETVDVTLNATKQNGYLYDITASQEKNNTSSAKDIESRRNQVIDYSDNDVTNRIAEILASHEKMPQDGEVASKLVELMDRTAMRAETGMIVAELECDKADTEYNDAVQGNYKLNGVNLGLEERPKAQLITNKEVTNVRLVLADGSTLFDTNQKATNVMWQQHNPYVVDMDGAYKVKGIDLLRKQTSYDAAYGLIQMTMDKELMHGASIKITYKITVTNVGEVDYKERSFYYTGNVADKSTLVYTQANQLVDYVSNNLQYYDVDNPTWTTISQDDLNKQDNPDERLINATLSTEIAKYNTIITTKANSNITSTALAPLIYKNAVDNKVASEASDTLTLTQLITAENDTDDLTYRNVVEIVKTSNDVGRRNGFSIVGNQNPTVNAANGLIEISDADADVAQVIKILPPYGNGGQNYVIAITILVSSLMLIAGIVFIKKKILK